MLLTDTKYTANSECKLLTLELITKRLMFVLNVAPKAGRRFRLERAFKQTNVNVLYLVKLTRFL